MPKPRRRWKAFYDDRVRKVVLARGVETAESPVKLADLERRGLELAVNGDLKTACELLQEAVDHRADLHIAHAMTPIDH